MISDTFEKAAAITVAERVIAELTRPLPIEGCQHLLGCSIGIALYPRDGEDADSLMRYADAAMYGAKRLGKNRYLMPK